MKRNDECTCATDNARKSNKWCPVHGKQQREQVYEEWRQRRMIQLWQGREDDDHE